MWKLALAAAAAGSGVLAKHLFTTHFAADQNTSQLELEKEQEEGDPPRNFRFSALQCSQTQPSPVSSAPDQSFDREISTSAIPGKGRVEDEEKIGEKDRSFFQFSSSGSSNRAGFRPKTKKSQGVGRKGKNVKNAGRSGRTNSGGDGHGNSSGKKRVSGGRRVSLKFKKRKTIKNSNGKCDPSYSGNVDNPSFGWGLSLGIMCMMSAGKTEISRLNEAVDETTKVVQELKSKLYETRFSPSFHNVCSSSSRSDNDHTNGKPNPPLHHVSTIDDAAECLSSGPPTCNAFSSADGENASSAITEEPMMDIDQLETELESEFQKLPLFMVDATSNLGNMGYNCYDEYSTSDSGGVSPSELSEKLSNVLIQQQEGHIVELESELNVAYTKLQEKEAELRSLKDCIKSLTKFSLSPAASDDEAEMY